MTDELTPTQALALWGLLARQGRAPEAEVKPKADRDALVAGGFVEAHKPSKTVSLTDKAWDWAGTHFEAELPPPQATLRHLLVRLGAHLEASNATLAEFIGLAPPLPEPEPTQKPVRRPKEPAPPKVEAEAKPKAEKVKAAPKPKALPKPKAPNAAALRQMIEDAYLRASGGARSEPVRLSRLRAELGGLDRKTIDAGLARIVKAKKETASLSSIGDNKDIDASEREAAYSPAGEPFHLIRIS